MTKWGSGDGNAPFPDAGIGVEALGHTYVVDRGNDRIEKFDSNGKFIVGSPGNGHSNKISDVNVGLVVKVYVSDNGNKNVQRIPVSKRVILGVLCIRSEDDDVFGKCQINYRRKIQIMLVLYNESWIKMLKSGLTISILRNIQKEDILSKHIGLKNL